MQVTATAVTPDLAELISALSVSRSVEEAWVATAQHFRAHGLPWLSYAYKECTPSGKLIDALSNIPSGVYKEWLSGGLYERDPMIRHVTASMLPGRFGLDYGGRDDEAFDVVRHYQRLADAGIRNAYVISLRCIVRSAPGYFMLGGPQSRDELEALIEDKGDKLALAVFYADLKLQEMFHLRLLGGVRLSTREKQCLELLSSGLKNDRIAERLGLSEVTVRLHFTNARNKLQTATREQAVAKAAMLGLIAP